MDETPSTTPLNDPSRAGNSSLSVWLVTSVAAIAALALAAAHAPPRIRLIGLFSIAFALLVGWLLGRLAERLDAHPSRGLIGTIAVFLSIAGLIGATWEAFRLELSRRPKSPNDAIAERLIEQMKTQTKLPPFENREQSALLAFRRYLSGRIRQLGEWSSPWPEVFWISELVTAAAASYWMATGRRRSFTRTSKNHKATTP